MEIVENFIFVVIFVLKAKCFVDGVDEIGKGQTHVGFINGVINVLHGEMDVFQGHTIALRRVTGDLSSLAAVVAAAGTNASDAAVQNLLIQQRRCGWKKASQSGSLHVLVIFKEGE